MCYILFKKNPGKFNRQINCSSFLKIGITHTPDEITRLITKVFHLMFALFKSNHLWDNKINYIKSAVGYSDINTYLSCNTNLKHLRVTISITRPIKTQKIHRPLLILTGKVQSLPKNWLKNVIDSDSSRKLLWCHYFDDNFQNTFKRFSYKTHKQLLLGCIYFLNFVRHSPENR